MDKPKRMVRVVDEPLPDLMTVVAKWVDAHAPKPAGGLRPEDAAKYVVSVIKSLLYVAADVATAAKAKEVYLTEADFLDMARGLFRAMEQAPRSQPSA